MTTNDPPAPASGEQRLKARQRRFYRYCLVVFAIAFVAGIVSGYVGGMVADGELPTWLIYITSVLFTGGFLWFTVDYFRRIDELDLLDNLWAGTVGFYFYFIAFPIWNSLYQFALAPPVDQWVLWIASVTVMFAAYGLRKVRARF